MLRPNFRTTPFKKIFLILWLAFSIIYVGWGEWSRFKAHVIERSYVVGRTDIINQIITEAAKCRIFPVTSQGKQVNLVNVNCGQQQPAQSAEEPK